MSAGAQKSGRRASLTVRASEKVGRPAQRAPALKRLNGPRALFRASANDPRKCVGCHPFRLAEHTGSVNQIRVGKRPGKRLSFLLNASPELPRPPNARDADRGPMKYMPT